MYEETQGITDFAAKIYMLAQIRAIVTAATPDAEVLTADIIRSVARDSLRQAQPVLAALRRGDARYISTVPDINPISTDDFIRQTQNLLQEKQKSGSAEKTDHDSLPSALPYGKTVGTEASNTTANSKPRRRKKQAEKDYDEKDLRAGIAKGAQLDKPAFEALDQAGHIALPAEYLDERGEEL